MANKFKIYNLIHGFIVVKKSYKIYHLTAFN